VEGGKRREWNAEKGAQNNSANGSKMARLLRSSQGQKNCPKIGAVVKLKNRVF
jgi:hypothetical protein